MRIAAIGLGLLTLARVAPAQSVGNMLKDDIKFVARDIGAVFTSPFDATGRDWLIVAGSFGAFGLAMLADQEASDWAIRNDSAAFFRALRPLRKGGELYSGKYVVPPIAALYVIGLVAKNQDMRDVLTGCLSSYAAEGAVRKGAAYLVGRARPESLPDNPQHWKIPNGYDEWQMRSFPAGHFANAMTCVAFANTRFKMGVVEPALYAVAAGIGVGRMVDKGHWLSDTVIGGILGYAVGREIGLRSRARDEARKSGATGAGAETGARFGMAPSSHGMNLSLSWTF